LHPKQQLNHAQISVDENPEATLQQMSRLMHSTTGSSVGRRFLGTAFSRNAEHSVFASHRGLTIEFPQLMRCQPLKHGAAALAATERKE